MAESEFKFHAPFLTGLDFVLNPSYQHKDGEACPISFFMQTNVGRNPDSKEAQVVVTVRINQDNVGNRDEEAPFWLTVSYSSRFSWEDDLSDEMVENLLKINAPSLLLSYIRPLVSQVTSVSPCPTYNIPYLNLNKMQEEIPSENN